MAVMSLPFWHPLLQAEPPRVESPKEGEILQGVVTIRGTTLTAGFESAEITFSYEGINADTWFLIHSTQKAVGGDTLGVWDTTTITDGDYRLRVLVRLTDGRQLTTEVPSLRVRNYTPVEMIPTAAPVEMPEPESLSQPVITNTPLPLAAPAAENPLQITSTRLVSSLGIGLAATLALFGGIGVYLALRAISRGR